MSAPTRFPNGVTNSSVTANLGNLPSPTTIGSFVDFHDFDQFVAGDWTETNTTSHGTIALVAGAGGIVSLAGGASSVSTDVIAIIKNPLDFNFTSSQRVWFETRLDVDVAANNLIIAGITSANATAAVTDGMYFSKAAGAATVDFTIAKSSAATTITSVATLANATYVRLGFYYDGSANVYVFVNDVMVARQTTLTNLPSGVALAPGLAMKLAATAPTTAYLNSDFILAAADRTNP